MPESHSFFTKMVDELVEFSEYDPELSDGIKWLDEQAQKKGLSFYDMVFHVLYKHDINTKAKEWLHSRNSIFDLFFGSFFNRDVFTSMWSSIFSNIDSLWSV